MEKQMQRQLDKKFGWVCHNREELIFGPRQFDNWVKRVVNEEPVVHVELGGVGFEDFRFNLFSPAKKRVWVEMFYHDGIKHTLLTCPLDDTTYNGCLRLINKIRRGLEWERHSMTAAGYRLRDHYWFKWQSTSWGQRYSVRFERGNEFYQNKVYVTFEYPDSGVRENKCWERKSFTSCGITQSMIYFEQRVNPLPLFERDLPTLVTRQMVEQGFLDPWAFGDGKLWEEGLMV